jgi:6-pyruvoyltetrahydropterin/6-carboxytetrahydropterin synthase
MSQRLVDRLAPRLKGLDRGGYRRGYRSGGKLSKTSPHQLVAGLLDALKVKYREEVPVPGVRGLVADFSVNGTWVFVDRKLGQRERKALETSRRDCVLITKEARLSDRFDHGFRVLGLGDSGTLQTIFLDDPSFNFDYAHILPKTQKCSVMHGHTSSVLVEVIGRPIEGMVVDFAEAKRIVRDAVSGLDHKLFISEKYVTSMSEEKVGLRFKTVHGDFAIQAPKDTTVIMDGEATVENLANEVLARIAPNMPRNVTAVGVYVYEGLNKGSHVLAQIHEDEVEKARKKP